MVIILNVKWGSIFQIWSATQNFNNNKSFSSFYIRSKSISLLPVYVLYSQQILFRVTTLRLWGTRAGNSYLYPQDLATPHQKKKSLEKVLIKDWWIINVLTYCASGQVCRSFGFFLGSLTITHHTNLVSHVIMKSKLFLSPEHALSLSSTLEYLFHHSISHFQYHSMIGLLNFLFMSLFTDL